MTTPPFHAALKDAFAALEARGLHAKTAATPPETVVEVKAPGVTLVRRVNSSAFLDPWAATPAPRQGFGKTPGEALRAAAKELRALADAFDAEPAPEAAPAPPEGERTTTLAGADGIDGTLDYAVEGFEDDACIEASCHTPPRYYAYGWTSEGFCYPIGRTFPTLDAALAALNAHEPTRARWGRLILPPDAP